MWIIDSWRRLTLKLRNQATLPLASCPDSTWARFQLKRKKDVFGQRKLLRLLNCQKILETKKYFKTIGNVRQESLEKMDQNQYRRYILRRNHIFWIGNCSDNGKSNGEKSKFDGHLKRLAFLQITKESTDGERKKRGIR